MMDEIITSNQGRKTKLSANEIDYNEEYGNYPSNQSDIIDYIRSNMKVDMKKYDSLKNHIQNLTWEKIFIEIYIVPKPSPRPRYSSATDKFYVKGAAYNKKSVMSLLDEYNIIYTTTKALIRTYQPTPKSMKPHEILLAEEGLITASTNPDFDNLAKTYTDMLQDNLLLNDNIITMGTVEKYYSLKPRVEIELEYATTFDCDYNRKRTLNSKKFVSLVSEETYENISKLRIG
jgi:Holliday junction resolvase RusA-like endonuclease